MWITRLFGQESASNTIVDPVSPRTQELEIWGAVDRDEVRCSCCKSPVRDLLSLAFPAPGICPKDYPKTSNEDFFKTDQDTLSDDFCRFEGHLFVRAVMEFPLPNYHTDMMVGVWGTLSQENFDLFAHHFENGTQDSLPMMFSWLSNPVPPGTKVPEPCALQPLGNHMRPRMMFADNETPIYAAQMDGLSYAELRNFLAKFGHDIPDLT